MQKSRATIIAAALVGAIGSVALAASGTAASADPIEGSWSGGGVVRFPSGETERARCRASFRKRGGSSFSMRAVCATASARVEQTAQVERDGGNRYSGAFQNAEYGVSGSIDITVRGSSLNASLNGGGGSATFRLGR